jgi:sporulation protein YlmC with PRC-barrel domain
MKVHSSELIDRDVMSHNGRLIGRIDTIVVDTKTGDVLHMLVYPSVEVDPRSYRMDNNGRIILPFNKIRSVSDVVVIGK